jgi:hypothetical protein
MKVDVYHLVLGKVYEAAGGNAKKLVNMLEIVKQEGFGGAKDDIFEFLNHEGWVVDSPTQGHVFITPWGMEEHKRFSSRSKPDKQKLIEEAVKESNKAASTARELADAFEQYAKALPVPEKDAEAKKIHANAMKLFDDMKKSVAATKVE